MGCVTTSDLRLRLTVKFTGANIETRHQVVTRRVRPSPREVHRFGWTTRPVAGFPRAPVRPRFRSTRIQGVPHSYKCRRRALAPSKRFGWRGRLRVVSRWRRRRPQRRRRGGRSPGVGGCTPWRCGIRMSSCDLHLRGATPASRTAMMKAALTIRGWTSPVPLACPSTAPTGGRYAEQANR
jgi:hypothetical protein